MRFRAGAMVVALLALCLAVPVNAAPSPKPPLPTGWTTYHHDNTRDGYDASAPAFQGGPFAHWGASVDCNVLAEPLVLSGVVYVATMCNSIYAFNATTGAQIWAKTSLAQDSTATHCSESGDDGIMGTPVIDPSTGILYAVGLVALVSSEVYRMFGLHISDGSAAAGFPVDLTVDPTYQNERGALALANGHVYVPFGGWIGDCGTYHPYVVSVPTSGVAQDHAFQPQTGCENGASLWGASGIAVDGSGNLYIATGNSTDDSTCMGGSTSYPCVNTSWDYGDGDLKLSPSLVLQSQWAPDNSAQSWCALNAADTDIGSIGPALLPNNTIFQTGKSGYGWMLNPTSLGGFNGQLAQHKLGACAPDAVFGGMAYYNGRVYVPCDGVGLVAINVNTTTHTFSGTPAWVQNVDPGAPIVAMGLVWVRDHGGNNLYGFDPATGTQRVDVALSGGNYNHFATLAEDHGWFFVPNGNGLDAFDFGIPPCASTSSTSWFASCSFSQYKLTGNNGSAWAHMDDTAPLSVTFTPSVASYAVLTANTSLWTSRAGYNQDVGIAVSGGAFPTTSGQPEAWKESGGARTFAPNAAFVQTVIPVAASTQYTATLVWKANVSDPYTIWAGAGPVAGLAYSPTRITAMLVPQSAGTVFFKSSASQYSLPGSDGAAWHNMDSGSNLSVQFTPPAGTWIAFVGANSDLWTKNGGFNQDIGVSMSGGAYPTAGGQPEFWKESGGGATFSPNAAFAHGALPVVAGTTYTATVQWKANRPDSGTIMAGAGPIGIKYSPTTLTVLLISASAASAVSSTQQYTDSSNDGATWDTVDGTNLQFTLSPGSDTNYLFSANADLWTNTGGFGQDIGIMVSGGSFGAGTVVAWQESGGAFTFSPNAAFAEGDVTLPGGSTYTITLVWKANQNDPNTIYAGAGNGPYSPTWLMATALP